MELNKLDVCACMFALNNIDKLAAAGTVFTDAHSPSAVCSPTRYGIMTGRYAWPAAIVATVACAPMIAYSLLVYRLDPFWAATYGTQNVMSAPAPFVVPFSFGLVLLVLLLWDLGNISLIAPSSRRGAVVSLCACIFFAIDSSASPIICAARIPAFVAPGFPIATVATGIPAGICTVESSESRVSIVSATRLRWSATSRK